MALTGEFKISPLSLNFCNLFRRSFPTQGLWVQMIIPVPAAALAQYIQDPNRLAIQVAFPKLNADQHEFIMTGMDGNAWAKIFPSDVFDVQRN